MPVRVPKRIYIKPRKNKTNERLYEQKKLASFPQSYKLQYNQEFPASHQLEISPPPKPTIQTHISPPLFPCRFPFIKGGIYLESKQADSEVPSFSLTCEYFHALGGLLKGFEMKKCLLCEINSALKRSGSKSVGQRLYAARHASSSKRNWHGDLDTSMV